MKPNAFTVAYSGIVNKLTLQCAVGAAFDPVRQGNKPLRVADFTALWDTGATASVITAKVVAALGLQPAGKQKVFNANGSAVVNRYMVCIRMPNRVIFPCLAVTEGCLKDADMLIGMDVISRGDFSLSNFGGKTTMSFCMPPVEAKDYVKEINEYNRLLKIHNAWKAHGDNKCPCGSKKQWENCHGKSIYK